MKHKIIYTDDYALIVSDEKIVIGDYVYCSREEFGFEPLAKQIVNPLGSNNDSGMFKVIAHRPLTDAPILEGVALLPPFSCSQQYGVEKLAEDKYPISVGGSMWMPSSHDMMQANKQEGFIEGYNKAKETYKYTEEDLIKAIELAQTPSDYDTFPLIDEVMQSLQQPKRPKYFECKEQKDCPFDFTSRCTMDRCDCKDKLKITTNLQGQTELVGSYIY
jgi:hypothetical protein